MATGDGVATRSKGWHGMWPKRGWGQQQMSEANKYCCHHFSARVANPPIVPCTAPPTPTLMVISTTLICAVLLQVVSFACHTTPIHFPHHIRNIADMPLFWDVAPVAVV